MYATIRHFRHNLEGRYFFVNTDHKPLTFVMSSVTECPSLRQTRQLAFIAEFTTDIRYVKGETNFVADALSRPTMSFIDNTSTINYKDLSTDQASDTEFTRLRHSKSSTINFKLLKSFDNNLIWCDVSTGHIRPYVTEKFRKQVFSNLHGLGYQSHRATKPLINTRFVWHGLNIDIAKWCRSCKGCQTAKISRHNKPVFGKFDEPTERFDHIHIDIVGPLPYANGFRYRNGMVERSIMAHESLNPWTITLPAVLLGTRSSVKELLDRSVAEIVNGMTLRLPGEFSHKYNVDAHTDLDNYSDKLRVAMWRLCPPRDSTQNKIFQFKEIDTCSHVFLRRIAIAPPMTAPYDGPYKVIVRSGRVMKILVKGKVETDSLDRVKPAHLDNEPIGTKKQRKTQTNAKNSKNTATFRREPAVKQNSEKKRAEPKAKTRTRSVAVQHGTNLATTSQHNANKVNLPQQFTPYVAPHSRIPAVSTLTGAPEVCERIHVYLCTYG